MYNRGDLIQVIKFWEDGSPNDCELSHTFETDHPSEMLQLFIVTQDRGNTSSPCISVAKPQLPHREHDNRFYHAEVQLVKRNYHTY